MISVNTEKPIFLQIVDMIEDDILIGVYNTDDMIISTNQISKLLSVNPTTANKAVGILTDKGIIYKKRGLGMAVCPQAKEIILSERKELFFSKTLPEFISHAEKIGIEKKELAKIIEKENTVND